MANLLDVNNLSIEFRTPAGPIHALRGISFRVRPKSSVALVGESGSGKSVSAQAIMGLLPRSAEITSGSIQFRDPNRGGAETDLAKLDVRSREFRQIRGGRISMIFQEPMTSLSPLHTIGDQVGETVRLHEGLTAAQAETRTLEMLKLVRFPNPERALRSYPFELSGGLRQRAMIAMALICRPALLIADEPTTALDVTVQAQILALIRDIQHEMDMSVLMITHDMGVVANVAEEVVVMYRGEVMESGTAKDIFSDPRHPYLKALMRAVPRIDGDPSERLKPLVEASADAAPLAKIDMRKRLESGLPLLAVDNVVKRYTIRNDEFSFSSKAAMQVTAVDHVSFDVRRGECLGLVGESGCGKTTVAKMIMSAITADKGKILFDEGGNTVDLNSLDEADLKPFRRRIQYIFQDPFGSLNPRMTVGDLLTEPLAVHGIGDKVWRRERAGELMRRVGIDPRYLSRYPHSFSGGQRQRIGIGRALILEPELVLCDEPVSALDVSTRAQVLNLLKDLQKELGLTLLFISHDLAVVNYIADRVAVMCRGKLVEVAPREQLFRAPQHPYTRALLASVPHPDLEHPLDFAAIGRGLMTEPKHWPAPFGTDGDAEPHLIDLGAGHLVRAIERPTPAQVA